MFAGISGTQSPPGLTTATVRRLRQAPLRAGAIRRSSACAGSATDPSSLAMRPAADEAVTDASTLHHRAHGCSDDVGAHGEHLLPGPESVAGSDVRGACCGRVVLHGGLRTAKGSSRPLAPRPDWQPAARQVLSQLSDPMQVRWILQDELDRAPKEAFPEASSADLFEAGSLVVFAQQLVPVYDKLQVSEGRDLLEELFRNAGRPLSALRCPRTRRCAAA